MVGRRDAVRTADPAVGREPGQTTRAILRRYILGTDHKDVGTLYLLLATLAGSVAVLLSIIMRAHQHTFGTSAAPLDNTLANAHGILMLFFVVIPAMFGGFGTYFVPLMIGAREMAFPRLHKLSFWLFVAGLALFLAALGFGTGARSGSSLGLTGAGAPQSSATAVLVTIVSIHLSGASSILASVNFIPTIFNMRAPGVGAHAMPLFVWAILCTALLMVLSLPVLAGATTLLLIHHGFATIFSSGHGASDHLFWFFGHPEVFMMILPAFGIVSQVVATFSNRPIFGYRAMVYALVAMTVVGFVVWAHQIYLVGVLHNGQTFFSLSTMVIAVPAGVAIFSWIATIWGGSIDLKTPMLWAMGFIFVLAVGGAMGLSLADRSLGPTAASTYDVLARFHYVMSLGAAFGLFAGLYYWIGTMSGRHYPEWAGKVHFWGTFVAVNLTFFPVHLLSAAAQDKAIGSRALAGWAFTSSLGAYMGALFFVFGLGVFAFTLLAGRRISVDDHWGDEAPSLEWREADATV